MHGNTGKQNAKKDITADSYLHIRITQANKALYVKAAQKEGLKLSQWVIKNLDTCLRSVY